MSTVVILAPIIISNWPVILAAVTGAASALGFVSVKEAVKAKTEVEGQVQNKESVELEVQESQVLAESVKTGQEIVLQKGTVELRVFRDERGRCKVCAKGVGHNKAELRTIAQEFMEKMTQCFVYNRVMSEIKNKNFNIVNEEVMDDQSIRINIRRWVD
ncbi:MAG: DUF1257 domain-containing protein [Phycisphaerae bacterium]